ncbi:MAG TPA: helix-turn-helix domain-containing protein [Acidimicrobiia bacterium]|nr:helix-turn-helix domain-containing protein [Acidimicrobiia bacterium]
MATTDPALRERLLEAAYACVARFGLAKTTVEDVVKESGLSRATVYRVFPGGKDELLAAVVGWEMGRFFGRLAEAVAGAADFAGLIEDGLGFAHGAVREHEVLQKILVTEPERLLPLMITEQERPLRFITAFLGPYLEREEREGRLRAGVDQARAAEFVARMLLSLISSPASWDLDDPEAVRRLVREDLLAGVLTDAALAR